MFRLGSVERFARNSASFVCSIHLAATLKPTGLGNDPVGSLSVVMHHDHPFIRDALMRANLQAGHTTSSAAGDDSARHKTAIVRTCALLASQGWSTSNVRISAVGFIKTVRRSG